MWNAFLGQSKLLQISIHVQEMKAWSHLFQMVQGILQQGLIAHNPGLTVPPRMVAKGSLILHRGRDLPRDWTLSKKRRWLSKLKKVKFWRFPLSVWGCWQWLAGSKWIYHCIWVLLFDPMVNNVRKRPLWHGFGIKLDPFQSDCDKFHPMKPLLWLFYSNHFQWCNCWHLTLLLTFMLAENLVIFFLQAFFRSSGYNSIHNLMWCRWRRL